MAFKVLILGGTSEARGLAERLAGDARYEVLLSFAGRTRSLQLPAAPYRVGGFGGAEGLAGFLRAESFDALVDATHAFAAQISRNAVAAAAASGRPLIRLAWPAWRAEPGDRWIDVPDMAAAAAAIGGEPRRVFLTIGRLEVGAFRAAAQHDYLIRAVDEFDPELPRARVMTARGPFALEAELALMRRERIEVLVSKNAGTPTTYAKILAARRLQLPVVMIQPPQLPAAMSAGSAQEIADWLAAHVPSAIQRGE